MSDDVVVPPKSLAVSMDEARRSARVDADEDGTSAFDVDIAREVRTYTRDAEHKTGRSFVHQTRELTLDHFPGSIRLPNAAPLVSVVHVKFYDASGVQQTLDPQDYMVDTKSKPGYVLAAPGRAWPATAPYVNAVEVRYVCGYGPDDTTVPDEAKSYILARVQQKFAPVANAKTENFERLLDPLMVYL